MIIDYLTIYLLFLWSNFYIFSIDLFPSILFPVFIVAEPITNGTFSISLSYFSNSNVKVKSESKSEVTQSCPTLWSPMDCSPPGSSSHGIFQSRILECIAIFYSRGSFQPWDWTWASALQADSLPSSHQKIPQV